MACDAALPWLAAWTPAVAPTGTRVARTIESLRPAGCDAVAPRWMPWLFRRDEERIHPVLVSAAARTSDAAVPWLLALLGRDDLARSGSLGGGRAPVAAARLLGTLGAVEAVPALLAALADGAPDEELADAALVALESMGPGAANALEAAWRGAPRVAPEGRRDVREGAAGALVLCAPDEPRAHEALAELLRGDALLGAMIAGHANSPGHLPLLSAALDETPVAADDVRAWSNPDVFELVSVIEALGGTLTRAQRTKARQVRALRDLASRLDALGVDPRGRGTHASHAAPPEEADDDRDDGEDDVTDDGGGGVGLHRTGGVPSAFVPRKPVASAPPPGRNDPCWCGSGRKYKKCHLASDDAGPAR